STDGLLCQLSQGATRLFQTPRMQLAELARCRAYVLAAARDHLIELGAGKCINGAVIPSQKLWFPALRQSADRATVASTSTLISTVERGRIDAHAVARARRSIL